MVLFAVLFVYPVARVWPKSMVLWLRRLGGKLGLPSDREGPYASGRHWRSLQRRRYTHLGCTKPLPKSKTMA